MKKVKVSIIIVAYKKDQEVIGSISSIDKVNPRISYEIIVVDNGPTSSLDKKINNLIRNHKNHKISYIKSPHNLGYGGGNNLGVKYANGEYLLILNPDTMVKNNAIETLVRFLDRNKNAAIVAPNLLNEKGNIYPQLGSRMLTPIRAIFALSFINKLFPGNPVSKKYFLSSDSIKRLREADAVPGSAFMIRKNVFYRVGRFDENIFLYFEESDLGKRVREAGWNIYINPEAEVIHKWLGRKRKSRKYKKIFMKSRFYYFKKHFGFLQALIVDLFTRFSSYHFFVLILLLLSAFLRFFILNKTMPFIGDHGWYYLSARNIFIKNQFPLVGIPSSVPVLRQGAVFTWFLSLLLKVGSFNPLFGGYFTAFLGVVSVLLVSKLSLDLFNKRIGLFAAFFTAVSPLIVIQDRTPFVFGPTFFLSLIVALLIVRAVKNKKSYFLLGISLSVIYQIELAAFILFFVVIAVHILLKMYPGIFNILNFMSGVFFGLSPLLIWDATQGVFIETLGFVFWVFTKIFEALTGVYSLKQILGISNTLFDYLSKLIFPSSKLIFIAIALFLMILFIIYSRKKHKYIKFGTTLVTAWLFIPLLGFLVRGVYSEAYMPIVYFPVIIIIALSLNEAWKISKTLGLSMALLLFIFNILFIFRNNFSFVKNQLTLEDRLEMANYLVNDSNNRRYELVYIGVNDHFASGDNHYKYLLWWLGNEPVERSNLKYVIIEEENIPSYLNAQEVININNIKVFKDEKG